MPHVFQAAPTGRAKCRGCGERIAAGELRFGESLPNPFAEGETTHWFHPDCGAYKRPEAFIEALAARPEAEGPLPDEERLRAEAELGVAHRRLPRVSGAERSPSGQAACRSCKQRIAKGVWRMPLVFFEEGRFNNAGFIHLPCALPYLETTAVLPRVRRFTPTLTEADVAEIEAGLREAPPAPLESGPANSG